MVRTLFDDAEHIPGRAVISDPKVIERLSLHLTKEDIAEITQMERQRAIDAHNLRYLLVD